MMEHASEKHYLWKNERRIILLHLFKIVINMEHYFLDMYEIKDLTFVRFTNIYGEESQNRGFFKKNFKPTVNEINKSCLILLSRIELSPLSGDERLVAPVIVN